MAMNAAANPNFLVRMEPPLSKNEVVASDILRRQPTKVAPGRNYNSVRLQQICVKWAANRMPPHLHGHRTRELRSRFSVEKHPA